MLCRFRIWPWWRTHPIPTPLVCGIEAKAFWQGPYRWTSYPVPYGFPNSASLKGDKDCNLKYFIDTLKFMAVLCLGKRYWPIFPDANRIPSLSACFLFLVPVIPLVYTQIFLQFCSFENITHHRMRLNEKFWYHLVNYKHILDVFRGIRNPKVHFAHTYHPPTHTNTCTRTYIYVFLPLNT